MLKHQGASRTAGTHMAGDGYVAAIAKRLGEDMLFSGAFVVFTTLCFFSRVLFGGLEKFRIFANGKGISISTIDQSTMCYLQIFLIIIWK